MVRLQSSRKDLGLCHYLLCGPTNLYAIKEVGNGVNCDWINHQAC